MEKIYYFRCWNCNELNVKVSDLTEEIDGLKFRLTLIDEDAVQKLRNSRIAEKTRADKAEKELGNLRSAHENLSMQWNALWKEPEFNEAAKKVKERKEREARIAAEAKPRLSTKPQKPRKNAILMPFLYSNFRAIKSPIGKITKKSVHKISLKFR